MFNIRIHFGTGSDCSHATFWNVQTSERTKASAIVWAYHVAKQLGLKVVGVDVKLSEMDGVL